MTAGMSSKTVLVCIGERKRQVHFSTSDIDETSALMLAIREDFHLDGSLGWGGPPEAEPSDMLCNAHPYCYMWPHLHTW